MNQEDWSVACYTLRKNPIAESRRNKMVGSAIGNEGHDQHYEATLPSVRDNIRVGREIQWIAGFELVVVCIERDAPAVFDDDKSMMEWNNAIEMILPVRSLNVEREVEHFLRQELNECMLQLELSVICAGNKCSVVYKVQMVVIGHMHDVSF